MPFSASKSLRNESDSDSSDSNTAGAETLSCGLSLLVSFSDILSKSVLALTSIFGDSGAGLSSSAGVGPSTFATGFLEMNMPINAFVFSRKVGEAGAVSVVVVVSSARVIIAFHHFFLCVIQVLILRVHSYHRGPLSHLSGW